MLKRHHSESLDNEELDDVDPVPVKRRSVDLPLQSQWRSAVVHQMSAVAADTPPTAPAPSVATSAPIGLLTAEDWACASELNDLFSANADHFPSIIVRSRSTFTRAERTAVAERIMASSSSLCSSSSLSSSSSSSTTQRATQHLALAAHVLTVAFTPYYPTAALSLYEIEAPSWLSGWTRKWCSAAEGLAPATPRNSPASSTSSLLSLSSPSCDDGSENNNEPPVVVVKLMALHGYAPGQPSCGQGAGLGEACLPATSQRRPAKTVFLPMW